MALPTLVAVRATLVERQCALAMPQALCPLPGVYSIAVCKAHGALPMPLAIQRLALIRGRAKLSWPGGPAVHLSRTGACVSVLYASLTKAQRCAQT